MVNADDERRDGASKDAMERLKYEVAEDLGLDDDIDERGWGNMTTREVGTIGGHMVKRLVRKAERDLAHEKGGH